MDQGCIDKALIERIRTRLTVDWRRTGQGDFFRMPRELKQLDLPSGPLGELWRELQDRAAAEALEKKLKPIVPLSPKAVEKVEKSLGFRLPDQLRQLYVEIGDGGFGPFNGIRRLSNWAKDYLKLRAQMPVERGREWPAQLLPIVYLNGKRICVDARSGEVVLWTKPPKRASERKWLASFVPQCASVQEWLERWVETPTQAEDGPEGGWTAPAQELERRHQEQARKDALARSAAEKARTFTAKDLPAIPGELVERVSARALDPQRRTFLAGAAEAAVSYTLDDIENELAKGAADIPPHARSGLGGILSGLQKLAPLTGGLSGVNMVSSPNGGMYMMRSGAGGKLGAPATDAAIAHAEAQLGFPLPQPLRQLYAIADGGFGPGDCGLFSLARLISSYNEVTARPQGPNGELWPHKLLPIYEADPAISCLDLETGKITVYDPSLMEGFHGGYWVRSFVTEHESLPAMLEEWLDRSTFQEEISNADGHSL